MLILIDEQWGSSLNYSLASEWIEGSRRRLEPRALVEETMLMSEALERKTQYQNTKTHNARLTLAKWMYGGGYAVFVYGKLKACPPLNLHLG